MKNLISILAFLYLFSFTLSAQDKDQIIQAFADSYEAEAEQAYEQAISFLLPFYQDKVYELNLRLGWLYYLNGNYPTSKKYYAKAKQLLPYAIEAKLGYALPLSALGNWEEAISTYQEILKIDPNNTFARYRLGAIYYQQEKYEQAHQQVEKVVNFYPFDYDSVILFAWINLQMNKTQKAKALFQKALMIRPASEAAAEGMELIE